ncbi:hypothetical protein [Streptomyces sp. NPDC054787]
MPDHHVSPASPLRFPFTSLSSSARDRRKRTESVHGRGRNRHQLPAWFLVLAFTIGEGLITEIEIVAEPERLAGIDLAVPDA